MRKKIEDKILKLKTKVLTKKFGGKEVLIELGLAIIGVVLLVAYKDQFTNLATTIMGKVTTSINGLFGSIAG